MSRLTRSVPALAAAAVLSIGGAAAAFGDDHDGGGHNNGEHHGKHHGKKVSAWDKQWLQMSIEGDLFEIRGGQLAQQKGSSQAVKDYGAKLVADHTKSLQDATDLAEKYGIDVPKAPSPTQQWQLQTVAKFTGKDFDTNYVDLEAKDHQQDISEAQDEVKEGCNHDIRADAEDEIPVLTEHLQIAQKLGGQLATDPLE
jgi:putative membrane protein